jgi:hypothetical protein
MVSNFVYHTVRNYPEFFHQIHKRKGEEALENPEDRVLTGIITSRKCPACGHHELGVTSKDGTFFPLRPGTRIQVLEGHPAQVPGSEELRATSEWVPKIVETESTFRPWAPDPVKGDRSLRLKYGVMVEEHLLIGKMNGEVFQAAYLEKLRSLIDKEVDVPIAVILDRFFTAPYLASGNPGEIVFNMWEELEEIRRPVVLVKAWLENPNEEHLINLIHPKSGEDLSSAPPSPKELQQELTQLSLEEFLGLL